MKQTMPYENTKVDWAKTQVELGALLRKYGIFESRFTNYAGKAIIEFLLPKRGWPVRIAIPVNLQNIKEVNTRWRALYWYVKSKMESIALGIVDEEQEWLPFIALGPAKTAGEVMVERLEEYGLEPHGFSGLLAAPSERYEEEP